MKTLSSLPPEFLAKFYRNQCDQVRSNIRLALGISFSDSPKVNLSKANVPQESPRP